MHEVHVPNSHRGRLARAHARVGEGREVAAVHFFGHKREQVGDLL